MQFVFPGQLKSFSSVYLDERFINKAQFDAGFAHRLILKDGAVSASPLERFLFCWRSALKDGVSDFW